MIAALLARTIVLCYRHEGRWPWLRRWREKAQAIVRRLLATKHKGVNDDPAR